MSETADTLIKFFTESDFWATNRDFLTREDVIHHEVHFETSIDPISLEYLFLEYLGVLERRVESIGHAIVGDTAYIKLYTIERPILNAVWRYNENVVISEQDPWYVSWSDADVASYLERVRPRRATAADAAKAEEFFESEAWLDVRRPSFTTRRRSISMCSCARSSTLTISITISGGGRKHGVQLAGSDVLPSAAAEASPGRARTRGGVARLCPRRNKVVRGELHLRARDRPQPEGTNGERTPLRGRRLDN